MTIPYKSNEDMHFSNNYNHGDFGILAMQVYFPQWYVDQSELEIHDNVPFGKYTIGLGQCTMAFCDMDEDVISMAMTVVEKLLSDYNIDASSIGRIEVGSESNPDRSKSIKSHIVGMYPQDWKSCSGTDCINACFGGTAAFLNSLNWLESREWNGKNALVVMSDIAVYEKWSPARPTGGAGAVALLLGPNAPIIVDRRISYYCENTFDFYKPNGEEYPKVDGRQSVNCYLRALKECFRQYHIPGDRYDGLLTHCPYSKIVQKACNLLSELDDSMDYQKISRDSLLLCKYLGNLYTASVYGSLASIISCGAFENDKMNNILVFSYGSGLISCMFQLKLVDSRALELFKRKLNLQERLKLRTKCSIDQYDGRQSNFGRKDLIILNSEINESRFYLKKIDSEYIRYYSHG